MNEYRIERAPGVGWWLFEKGVHNTTKDVVWWHVYQKDGPTRKYYAVYKTIDDVCAQLKEMTDGD